MSREVQQTQSAGGTLPVNPFSKPMDPRTSAGAVAIEADRAIAEAQGRMIIAKRFPRVEAEAYERIMEECKRHTLADEAIYSFPRGGETIEGPSIRLAEVIARNWGNMDFGIRELSRRQGESEMEAFACDLQTNTRTVQQFTVAHSRDTKSKGKVALTDDRDIYEVGANQAARRLRARILAIIPGDLVDAALEQCRRTLEGKNDIPMADRVRKMVDAFKVLSVTPKMLQQRLGHPLDDMTPDELRQLQGAYKSIRDNMTKVSDWFGVGGGDSPQADAITEALKNGAAQAVQQQSDRTPLEVALHGIEIATTTEAVAEARDGFLSMGPSPDDAARVTREASARIQLLTKG